MQQYTLEDLRAAGLDKHLGAVQGIAHAAGQELAIECAVAGMQAAWNMVRVSVLKTDTASGQQGLHLGDNAHIQVELALAICLLGSVMEAMLTLPSTLVLKLRALLMIIMRSCAHNCLPWHLVSLPAS